MDRYTLGNPPYRLIFLLAAALVLSTLQACGGGTGGSGSGPPPPPPPPAAPVASNDAYVVANGGNLGVIAPGVLANDSGAGTLTVTLVTNVSHGTLTLNADGSFTYRHDGSASNDSFVYRVSNGTATSNNAMVTLKLNQTPVATNACYSTPVNTTKTDALPATDPDGQPLLYEIVSPPNKGSVSADGSGNFSYTPRSNVRGLDQFRFRVRDPNGAESEATVSMLIDGAVRIMPLGDSITEGVVNGLAEDPPVSQRVAYRRKLYNDLNALTNRYTFDFVGSLSHGAGANPPLLDPNHEGHGGASDAQTAAGIMGWLNNNPADIILLHIGTNAFDTSPSDVEAILNNINAWENANYPVWVFIARIIKSASGNLDVTTFNNNVAAMVAARGSNRLFMVDQENGAGINYNTEMGDNLHPNPIGYDKMADKWKADLLTAAILPSCP